MSTTFSPEDIVKIFTKWVSIIGSEFEGGVSDLLLEIISSMKANERQDVIDKLWKRKLYDELSNEPLFSVNSSGLIINNQMVSVMSTPNMEDMRAEIVGRCISMSNNSLNSTDGADITSLVSKFFPKLVRKK